MEPKGASKKFLDKFKARARMSPGQAFQEMVVNEWLVWQELRLYGCVQFRALRRSSHSFRRGHGGAAELRVSARI